MPSLSLRLDQSLALTQRLGLEQSLAVELRQGLRLKLKLELALYRKREKSMTDLYGQALAAGLVLRYSRHGIMGEFALVSRQDVPKEILEQCGHAFSHCLMNGWDALLGGRQYALARGSWLCFVVGDMYGEPMPPKAIEYAAVHERGEMATLGDHARATKLEFAIAEKEGQLDWYLDWLERVAPGKFGDVFNFHVHTAIPDTREHQKILEAWQGSKPVRHILEMIESFEWPAPVAERLLSWKEANLRIGGLLNAAMRVATEESWGNMPVPAAIDQIRSRIQEVLAPLRGSDDLRKLTVVRHDAMWKNARGQLDANFLRWLNKRQSGLSREEYIKQMAAADCGNGLPHKGVLSPDVREVLSSL